MHPSSTFRKMPEEACRSFAKQRAFGVLSVNGDLGPVMAHVPFLLEGDGARLHLLRSNPIARSPLPAPAVIAVSGPDGYISPDWYGVDDQVPTWNYVAVHLRGVLEPLPDDTLHGLLDDISDAMESRLAPKPVWRSTKMTDGVMERMMRQIRPFRLRIEDVQGTWKLGQNKPDPVRRAAADKVETGFGADLEMLKTLMQDPPA
ncbi:MAG: negative transcriptional regulator [Rhodobacterales bacterium]|nr:MAG: negative transcriptional regulator [Rhodobacterales bacterium]